MAHREKENQTTMRTQTVKQLSCMRWDWAKIALATLQQLVLDSFKTCK